MLECRGILADIDPPYVLDGASAAAVDSLGLGGADDGVLDVCAVFEDEHRVGFGCLGLSLANAGVTLVLEKLSIEHAGDDDGGWEGSGACCDWEGG